MNEKNWPAFPTSLANNPHGIYGGMSLRAWLAGQSLSGIIAADVVATQKWDTKNVAGEAVRLADAVLAELTKQPGWRE